MHQHMKNEVLTFFSILIIDIKEGEDKEPGRTSHTKPHYDPGMFVNVESFSDFVAALEVPKDAIAMQFL